MAGYSSSERRSGNSTGSWVSDADTPIIHSWLSRPWTPGRMHNTGVASTDPGEVWRVFPTTNFTRLAGICRQVLHHIFGSIVLRLHFIFKRHLFSTYKIHPFTFFSLRCFYLITFFISLLRFTFSIHFFFILLYYSTYLSFCSLCMHFTPLIIHVVHFIPCLNLHLDWVFSLIRNFFEEYAIELGGGEFRTIVETFHNYIFDIVNERKIDLIKNQL